MPRPEDYEALAPFTMDELVSAVNSIFREKPVLAVQPRTVRFYVSNGLLPPPSGGPKFARYTMEHLNRIIAVRHWLDQGITLEESGIKIAEGEHLRPFEELMAPIVHVPRMKSESRRGYLKEDHHSYRKRGPEGSLVRRLKLTRNTTLEVSESADLYRELNLAIEKIREIQNSL